MLRFVLAPLRLLLSVSTLTVQAFALAALGGAAVSLLVLPWWESAAVAAACYAVAALAAKARHRFA